MLKVNKSFYLCKMRIKKFKDKDKSDPSKYICILNTLFGCRFCLEKCYYSVTIAVPHYITLHQLVFIISSTLTSQDSCICHLTRVCFIMPVLNKTLGFSNHFYWKKFTITLTHEEIMSTSIISVTTTVWIIWYISSSYFAQVMDITINRKHFVSYAHVST